MKALMIWQDCQPLKSTVHKLQNRNQSELGLKLNNIWQTVIANLVASSEPRVWKKEVAGSTYWSAYDATTGRSASYLSETDMRAWLEERHYQYSPSATERPQLLY